ncbi:BlaI/MecI/CopY family transcriptional regulator [Amycolatopsis benzoatilytica]|uniref:BlaI/MecI/CopY family transcriptional regulator n=1 Tax=Amycolatopsis benzoatilytica TaxID=346045 RepID=UPI000379B677|nr:BlaI/MecI/CopY family transcriptional regulator [Amycolatopsis benzoatilytica]
MSGGEQSRARRAAGALESEVMAALWAAPTPLSGAAVHEAVGADLSYKTVLTVLTRLYEKGLAERTASGRGHVYSPRRAHADLTAQRMNVALREARDRGAALQKFVTTLEPEDAAALREMLADGDRRPGGRP